MLPGFDFFFFGMCCHGMLRKLTMQGMGALHSYYEKRGQEELEHGDSELNFHKVAGVQLRRFQQMLDDGVLKVR